MNLGSKTRTAVILALWMGAGGFPVVPGSTAVAGPVNEYEVKAAFLFHFIQFVEWPADVVPAAGGAFTIGVLGTDPFGPLLDKTVKDEVVIGRAVTIRRFHDAEAVTACHVLFISQSEKERMPLILKRLEAMPILTVGECDGFAERGGMVNFFIEKNRIRFEINQNMAFRKGLKISSKLLALGRIVGPNAVKEAP